MAFRKIETQFRNRTFTASCASAFVGVFIQLTSVCGASTGAVVVFCEMARWDSTTSVVAKAQHEPEKEVGMS